nr:thioesterase family protein [uncultured Pseudogulbenkiania sp.]
MSALTLYRDEVRAEWVDYNGHLRDAFYLLLFSYAADALIDAIGLDAAERERSRRSVYTLEVHLNYLHELKQGEAVRVDCQLLAHDSKRLHVYFTLHRGDEAEPVAASEQMLLHVDTERACSAPFGAAVLARVETLAAAHAGLPRPAYAGRVIGLPRRVGTEGGAR